MRILIADKFPEAQLHQIRLMGHDVTYEPSVKGDALVKLAPGQNVLVVRSSQVTAEAIGAADALRLIIRAGAGYNNIDVKAASARGVLVSTCPGKNAVAVAELAMGLLLAVDRYLPDNVADFRAGKWNKAAYSAAEGLMGRHVGVIGFGQIGREFAARAQAFGMPVFVWSRSLTRETADRYAVNFCASVDEVLAHCGIVSLHVALTPETKGLLSRERIAAMKDKSVVINTARAEVVDEEALMEAVKTRGFRAGVDVMVGEPSGGTGAVSSPLAGLGGVYVTHHIGASTNQAQSAIADEVMRIISTFETEGTALNCVNLRRRSPAVAQLVIVHRDKVGVLADVLGTIRKFAINVEEMENTMFAEGGTAIARIRLGSEPPGDLFAALRETCADILHVESVRL